MAKELELDTGKIFNGKYLIIKVKHTRQTRFRFWLASRLIIWLMGAAGADLVHEACDCGKCGNACAYVEPYGFVPEAGCPVHDADDGED